MKSNPDAAFIKRTAQAMENQGVHSVTIEGTRLKFTNGQGAFPDVALSPDGGKLTGNATVPGTQRRVTFDGFCVK